MQDAEGLLCCKASAAPDKAPVATVERLNSVITVAL